MVLVGAMKIYVAAVEALRKKERQDETQFTTKIGEEKYKSNNIRKIIVVHALQIIQTN